MKTDFSLITYNFSDPDADDRTPEQIARCCKWFEDILTLNNPKFTDLTATSQRDFYYTGIVKSAGWRYIAKESVRVFVCEDGDKDGNWHVRFVPTKELAEQYIKAFSESDPIMWFFYDDSKVNMIEA